ncbi:hypothetical protein GLOTRDRAFT_44200, partial [Gloeophyllum trabeum ATCC 11539]
SVIIAQMAHHRSQRSLHFQAIHGFLLWANGASRQTIDILQKLSLSVSFDSTLDMVQNIADACIQRARLVARGPHAFCYDNVQISTSIHVEQREDGPAKVQCGTFGILYELRNASRDAMLLVPIMERYRNAKKLDYEEHVRPTKQQQQFVSQQLTVHLIECLYKFSGVFKLPEGESFESKFPHPPRRRMPPDHKTNEFPLRTTMNEEGSIDGNVRSIEHTYYQQLDMDAKLQRRGDINAFTRLDVFQLGFGLFHFIMNFIWALLHVHRSTLAQEGSLAFFFTVLERARLGSEHPDFYTLFAAMMDVLSGLILNAWEIECGYPSLADFAASNPSKEQLESIAQRIL